MIQKASMAKYEIAHVLYSETFVVYPEQAR